MEETKEPKMIRFIDSSYNLLFKIPDGGKIALLDLDGIKRIRVCKYIDEYHFRFAWGETFHICQFAEIMERNKTQYLPETPTDLPDMCYSTLQSSGELIVIKRDEAGYFPCTYGSKSSIQNQRTAKNLNEQMGVTPRQRAAMEAGSMFGWTVPAANPNHYDAHGIPLPQNDPEKAVTYTIYQLKELPETRDYRFVPLFELPEQAKSVIADYYDYVYSEELHPDANSTNQSLLDNLYFRFNLDCPSDFTGHSLSVSDIVVIERNHAHRAYYVDTIGFTELSAFPAPENPLRTAEISAEQNLNSIDGQINNLPQTEQGETEKKASIQAKIHAPKQGKVAKAPVRSDHTDRER